MPFEDSELDRLAAERDRAFRRVDEKRSALDDASNYRTHLRSAYDYKLDYLKSRIPALKAEIDYAYGQSRSCYEARDGAGAKSWSEQAGRLKEERSEAYDEKNRMIEELKAANERFQTALTEFREAKAEFEAARDAFTRRLNYLKEESTRRRAEREAERKESQRKREREQQERQQRWQHVQDQREVFVQLAKARAIQKREQEYKANVGPRYLQDRNTDFTVKVKSGWDKESGRIITDILIFPRGASEHLHMGIDENGDEVFSEWNPNH